MRRGRERIGAQGQRAAKAMAHEARIADHGRELRNFEDKERSLAAAERSQRSEGSRAGSADLDARAEAAGGFADRVADAAVGDRVEVSVDGGAGKKERK